MLNPKRKTRQISKAKLEELLKINFKSGVTTHLDADDITLHVRNATVGFETELVATLTAHKGNSTVSVHIPPSVYLFLHQAFEDLSEGLQFLEGFGNQG